MNNDTRRHNLRLLIAETGKAVDFGKRFQFDPAYLSQLVNGHRNIGEKTARKLESAAGKPRGWLDNKPDARSVDAGPNIKGLIPLISWIQAGDFCEAADTLHPNDAEQWLPCPVNHGARAYALRVRGASMQPRFNDGDIIMVDPDGSADHGRFVVAKKMDDHELSFKQLICESGHTYLKALNPNWPEPIIRLNQEWHVCGVVICKVEML